MFKSRKNNRKPRQSTDHGIDFSNKKISMKKTCADLKMSRFVPGECEQNGGLEKESKFKALNFASTVTI
jgi:hypothetical protein